MPAKFRRSVARSPKKDPQQYLLYRAEEECLGGLARGKMTLGEMQTFGNAVARNYRVSRPTFKFKDLGSWGGQCWTDGTIEINPNRKRARGILTVAHEVAHHLHNQLAEDNYDRHQPHGSEFMCCYMSLLDTARILPLVASRAIFKSYGLKFVDPGEEPKLSVLRELLSKS